MKVTIAPFDSSVDKRIEIDVEDVVYTPAAVSCSACDGDGWIGGSAADDSSEECETCSGQGHVPNKSYESFEHDVKVFVDADDVPTGAALALATMIKQMPEARKAVADVGKVRVLLHGRELSTGAFAHTAGDVDAQLRALIDDHKRLALENRHVHDVAEAPRTMTEAEIQASPVVGRLLKELASISAERDAAHEWLRQTLEALGGSLPSFPSVPARVARLRKALERARAVIFDEQVASHTGLPHLDPEVEAIDAALKPSKT